MPIIASKIVAGGLAAATALGSAVGGYFVKDDISDVAEMATNYIEVKIDRHSNEMAAGAVNNAISQRFSDKGGNL